MSFLDSGVLDDRWSAFLGVSSAVCPWASQSDSNDAAHRESPSPKNPTAARCGLSEKRYRLDMGNWDRNELESADNVGVIGMGATRRGGKAITGCLTILGVSDSWVLIEFTYCLEHSASGGERSEKSVDLFFPGSPS